MEIVVDAERNRLLVRGDAQIQQWTADLLAKLDRPAADAGRGARCLASLSAEQQLESYALTPATRDVLLAWQRYAGQRNDLRVAIDERTSQALVLAPPALHTQLRTELTQARPPQPNANTHRHSKLRQANAPAGPVHSNCITSSPVNCGNGLNALFRSRWRPAGTPPASGKPLRSKRRPAPPSPCRSTRDSGAVQLNGDAGSHGRLAIGHRSA